MPAAGAPWSGHYADRVIAVATYAVVGLGFALLALAGWYAWRDRLVDDRVLLLAALLEVLLVVQAVAGLLGMGEIRDDTEKATFAAYLVTLPLVPVATIYLAIKEKTRWAMGAVAVGAFAVAVMMIRCQQIWTIGRG